MTVAFDASAESHTGTAGSVLQGSFGWTHTPSGTPKGVIVYVFTLNASATVATSVTYGGVDLTLASTAQDTAGEPGSCQAWFLGASIPTGAQTVTVNRTNNATEAYAVSATVTAAVDTEIYTAGIVTAASDGTLAEVSVDDGSPGSNSLRFAGVYTGLQTLPTAGASSTLLRSIDAGSVGAVVVRETTAGQGSRSVGFSSGTSDDRAAIYLAVAEKLAVRASASNSFASITQSSTATITASCLASQTLTSISQSAVATVIDLASTAQTLATITQTAAAAVVDSATAAGTLSAITQTVTSAAVVAASAGQTLASVSQAAVATDPVAATASAAFASLTQTAACAATVASSAAQSLATVTQTAAASAIDAATASQALASLAQSATSSALVSVTSATTFDGLSQSATSVAVAAASAARSLASVDQSAVAANPIAAVAAQSLETVAQSATATVDGAALSAEATQSFDGVSQQATAVVSDDRYASASQTLDGVTSTAAAGRTLFTIVASVPNAPDFTPVTVNSSHAVWVDQAGSNPTDWQSTGRAKHPTWTVTKRAA